MFSRFDPIPACDRQTDKWTGKQTESDLLNLPPTPKKFRHGSRIRDTLKQNTLAYRTYLSKNTSMTRFIR